MKSVMEAIVENAREENEKKMKAEIVERIGRMLLGANIKEIKIEDEQLVSMIIEKDGKTYILVSDENENGTFLDVLETFLDEPEST